MRMIWFQWECRANIGAFAFESALCGSRTGVLRAERASDPLIREVAQRQKSTRLLRWFDGRCKVSIGNSYEFECVLLNVCFRGLLRSLAKRLARQCLPLARLPKDHAGSLIYRRKAEKAFMLPSAYVPATGAPFMSASRLPTTMGWCQ